MPQQGSTPQFIAQLKRVRDDALLDISDAIIAGRHSSCGINLSDEEGASRKHARFNLIDGKLTITDLGSLNGTLVNGREIDGKHVLSNSDIIVFDTDKYELCMAQTTNSTSPNTSSSSDTVIANKAERINPASITPAIRVLPNTANDEPSKDQHANTVEYLSSLPQPDMKRPVGMPDNIQSSSRYVTIAKKWLLPLLAITVLLVVAYQLGLRAA